MTYKNIDIDKEVIKRFVARMVFGATDACWEWPGAKDAAGYGKIRSNRKEIGTHRIAYYLAQNHLPTNTHVLHKCDNPPCVNPKHLRLGTHDENMKDKSLKERSGSCKLTKEKVLKIRELYNLKSHSQKELAEIFGVNSSSIYAIVHKFSWKYI